MAMALTKAATVEDMVAADDGCRYDLIRESRVACRPPGITTVRSPGDSADRAHLPRRGAGAAARPGGRNRSPQAKRSSPQRGHGGGALGGFAVEFRPSRSTLIDGVQIRKGSEGCAT